MIYGIFTGHGNFAIESVNAAMEIIGKRDHFSCISNRGLDIDRIREILEKAIDANKARHYIIFIDFYGSSFSLPALEIERSRSNVSLIFGYNMPVIIDFFAHRVKKGPSALKEKLINIGREAIKS